MICFCTHCFPSVKYCKSHDVLVIHEHSYMLSEHVYLHSIPIHGWQSPCHKDVPLLPMIWIYLIYYRSFIGSQREEWGAVCNSQCALSVAVSLQENTQHILYVCANMWWTVVNKLFLHLFWMFHSIWLVSLATQGGPGLLDAVVRVFQPNRASCWREEELCRCVCF